MRTKQQEKDINDKIKIIVKLWTKIDKLTIENKMLKNENKKLKKYLP